MRERKHVKLRVDMYEDTKFKIIDTMEDRDVIHYIWTRLLTLAGKVNLEGNLYMSKNIPYTIETLSLEFNRSVEKVTLALKVLKDLEIIKCNEEGVYKIRNFAKHQNIKVKEQNKNIAVNEDIKGKGDIIKDIDNKDEVEYTKDKNYREDIQNNKEQINNVDQVKTVNKENVNLENELNKPSNIIDFKNKKDISLDYENINQQENESINLDVKNSNVDNNYTEIKTVHNEDLNFKTVDNKELESKNENNKNVYINESNSKEKLESDLNSNMQISLKKKKTRKRKQPSNKSKGKNDIVEIDYEDDEIMGFFDGEEIPKREGETVISSFEW